MTKAVTTRNPWIVILAVGLILWFILKNRQAAQYLNEEHWFVEYTADGLPTKITIHRNAKRI